MKTKKADPNNLSQAETRLIEQLRKHPEMMVRSTSHYETQ